MILHIACLLLTLATQDTNAAMLGWTLSINGYMLSFGKQEEVRHA
jgi:hypothetical protein